MLSTGQWGFFIGITLFVVFGGIALVYKFQQRRQTADGPAVPRAQRLPATPRPATLQQRQQPAPVAPAPVPAAPRQEQVPQAPALIPAPTTTLQQIARERGGNVRVQVIAATTAGKTTTLRTLIAEVRGAVLALDPHNTPGKWPAVVGGGGNYVEIDEALDRAVELLDRRLGQLNLGEIAEERFSQVYLVMDEWRSIRSNLKAKLSTRGISAADRLVRLITEGRKVNMGVLVGVHNDTAETYGVSGERDLLESFSYSIFLDGMARDRVPQDLRPAMEEMSYPIIVKNNKTRQWLLCPASPIVPERRYAMTNDDQEVLAQLTGAEPLEKSAEMERAISGRISDEISASQSGKTPDEGAISAISEAEKTRKVALISAGILSGKKKADLAKEVGMSGGSYGKFCRLYDEAESALKGAALI